MCAMPLKPLMNIPKTKHHQYQQSECCAAKIMMGLGGEGGGGFVMLKMSRQSEVALHAFVASNCHLCGG